MVEQTSKYNCYLCDGTSWEYYSFPKSVYSIVKCESCGFLRVNPLPNDSTIKDLYSGDHNSDNDLSYEVFSSTFLTFIKKHIVIKPLINLLKKEFEQQKPPLLLDIGCSTGWITSISRDAGFEVLGLEANPHCAKFGMGKYSLNIVEGYIEEFEFEEKFDAVTMFHLFEHLSNPIYTLKTIKSVINDNGRLLIVVPNVDSLSARLFKENYKWSVPHHLSFFSPSTVKLVLNKTGFSIIKILHLTSPSLLMYSFNKLMNRRRNQKKFNYRPNPLIGNFLFTPLALFGKLLRKGEVIAVLAKKAA